LAFTVAPCNLNEKRFIEPLLEKLMGQGISFETVLADAQYDSSKVRETVREYVLNQLYHTGKTPRLRVASPRPPTS